MAEPKAEYKDRRSPKYLEAVQDAINDRSTWNKKDTLIMKRRLGERKTTKRKYRNAPEPVVPIIDDTVRERSEQEISMIMNAPRLAHFIPLNPDTPEEITQRAAIAFDTYLRHFMHYRRLKDEEVDTKNARGFAVTKLVRTEHDYLGVISSAISIDPKDIIVPSNTQRPSTAAFVTHVLRLTISDLMQRKKEKGWRNVDTLLQRFGAQDRYSTIANDGTTSTSSTSTTQYSASDEENDPLRATEKLVGINTTQIKGGRIVVWEVYHPADEWDVAHDWTGEVVKDKHCMTYFCPDQPDLLLNIMAWKYPDEMDTVAVINEETQEIEQQVVVTKEGEWRPCPYVQHRFENRSGWWYDTRGLGHLNMDNQLTASGLKKRRLILADYYSSPVFVNDGNQGTNTTNVRLDMGNVLPRGIKPAALPTPPPTLDFSIDTEKREASMRSGAGQNMFSGQMSENRKIQKTASEVVSQEAQRAMLSSAGVDRFNDADKELFAMLWRDLKELKVQLPLIANNKNQGNAGLEIYNYDFIIVPASSQKTLNPDMQFAKWQGVFNMMLNTLQVVPNQDVVAQLRHGLAYFDPQYAEIALIDPNEANGGQAPIFKQLEEIKQAIAQIGQAVENNMKLSVENAQKLEQIGNAGQSENLDVPSFMR